MRNIGKIYKLFLLLVLFSGNLSAQTVTIDGGDHPVIDLSALQPSGIALSFAEASDRRTEMKDAKVTTDLSLVKAAVSGYDGTWNAKMSGKFQVMCTDYGDGIMNWTTAYETCRSYIGEGSNEKGEWRLPTHRELMQIMILHPQLIGKGNFQTLTAKAEYWSLTEFNSEGVYYLDTDTGQMYYETLNKRDYYSGRVRCVRDLK